MDILSLEPIQQLTKKINSSSEFEIIFNKKNPLSINKYIDISKYLIHLSLKNKFKLVKESTLDVGFTNYVNKDIVNYRVSINTIDTINKIINKVKLRKNHVIFSVLVSDVLNNEKNITIMKKTKLDKNTVDIDDYDMRVRLSEENDVSKEEMQKLLQLEENERFNIVFRFKQRLSVVLSSDDNHELKIDLTQAKQSNNINEIVRALDRYELELDLSTFGKFNEKAVYKIMNEYIEKIYKTSMNSNTLITTTEQISILEKYNQLVYGDKDNTAKDLAGMQSVSLEIQHLVDYLPSKYTVTDKADGERNFLYISDGKVYLISNNLNIIKTDHEVDKKYNETLIDGELIFLNKYNKYVFLGFDILFDKGVDVRDTVKMVDRYYILSECIQKIFGSKLDDVIYKGEFDLKKIGDHLKISVKKYMDDLNKSLKNDKSLFIIKYKVYSFPTGGNGCELFHNSNIMWELYTKDLDCPYTLDGLIYSPLEQKYTRNKREQKFQNLKWKPKEKNSIDFYIEFERNEQKEIVDVYDDSTVKEIKDDTGLAEQSLLNLNNKIGGKLYRIANLYTGKSKNDIEYPVLFHKETHGYIAHLFLDGKEPRDHEGNIIQDKTVVEFAYNNNIEVPETDRWIPLRTRFDKTEFVKKYKRKYGNNESVAEKVWRSILMPVDINDIQALSDPKMFDNYITTMRGKINAKLIETARGEDIYYQKHTDLAKPQRAFHNWIKSSLIYNYCSKNLTGQKVTVLDIGIGRGGDIMKYFSARIGELVGIDVDSNGIYSATDGAVSRYNNMKKKFPQFPKMTFMLADGGAKLNVEDQIKAVGSMDDKNKESLKYVFGNTMNDKCMKFDIISSQFVLHYMFKDDTTFNNLCDNINRLLKSSGYLVFTTMDGDLMHKEFKNNGLGGKIESYYTDKEGKKQKFLGINAKYDIKQDINKTGCAIDMYNASFLEEGTSIIEYVVPSKFVIEKFKEKCNLELVEEENFGNIYYIFEKFFKETAIHEEELRTRKYFEETSQYYDLKDEVNRASFELTRLSKVYVFQKRDKKFSANVKRTTMPKGMK